MGKAWVIDDTAIDITDGTIKIDGIEVGSVFNELKHGYHPAIKLKIAGVIEWFEMDTKNLVDVIAEKAVELHNAAGG